MNTNETLNTSTNLYNEQEIAMEIKEALQDYFVATITTGKHNSFHLTLPNKQSFVVCVTATN